MRRFPRRAVRFAVRLGVAAAVVGALVAATSRRRRPPAGPIAHTGATARTARLARLGAQTSATTAVHRTRRVFASAERREVLDREHELQTAAAVAAELGNMKGALMKLGQMVSYLDEGLPEAFRDALAQLQHDAPPMSAGLAAEVVERELGRAPEQVFAEWDPVPIAAASIGQVHRAITHDGAAVAVKVQYPGVAEAIEADLGSVGLLFGAMGQVLPGLDSGPLIDELRARLREELDYHREARSQQRFADHYAGHPFIHIPSVLLDHSSQRVLTTELAEGVRMDEVLTWEQAEKDLAGETIFRFVFSSLYQLHLFNGDPHPGNYLFRPGGRVTFLDFGLVKQFDAKEIVLIRALIETMVIHPDPSQFRVAVEDAGFLTHGAAVTDDEVQDYFGHFYDHVRVNQRVTMTPEFASETVRRFFDPSPEHRALLRYANVPPSFVVVQRINLGLFAVLAQLGATANWRRIADEIWPWVGAAPSTPLGNLDAAWRTDPKTGEGAL